LLKLRNYFEILLNLEFNRKKSSLTELLNQCSCNLHNIYFIV